MVILYSYLEEDDMKKKVIFLICFLLLTSLGVILLLNRYCIQDKKPLQSNTVKNIGIEGLQEYYRVPGFTYCIISDGKIIKMDALGYIFEGSERKVSIQDKFKIGSCCKSYTALIASKLVEKGLISWDTRLFDLFPEWKSNSNQAYYSISLKDLLSHNTSLQPFNTFTGKSGFFSKEVIYTNIPSFAGNQQERRLQFCKYVLTLPPVKSTEMNYANSGYSIAGIMLEKVSGKSWEDLAMETARDIGVSISFGNPNSIDREMPWGHKVGWFGKRIPVSPEDYSGFIDPITAPAGDLDISINDMATYVKIYLDGLNGKDGYITSQTCKYLLSGIPKYAMGWYNESDSETIFYHYGSEGTFYSNVMIFKELNSAIIIFTNAPGCKDTQNFLNDLRNYLKGRFITKSIV